MRGRGFASHKVGGADSQRSCSSTKTMLSQGRACLSCLILVPTLLTSCALGDEGMTADTALPTYVSMFQRTADFVCYYADECAENNTRPVFVLGSSLADCCGKPSVVTALDLTTQNCGTCGEI